MIKNIVKDKTNEFGDLEWVLAQAEEDLENLSPEMYIEKHLVTKLIGWKHPMFHEIKCRQEEQDDYILNPYEVEEGVIECIKCKGRRVFSTTIQTRAADEPMTTIAHCVACKTKWSQNG